MRAYVYAIVKRSYIFRDHEGFSFDDLVQNQGVTTDKKLAEKRAASLNKRHQNKSKKDPLYSSVNPVPFSVKKLYCKDILG